MKYRASPGDQVESPGTGDESRQWGPPFVGPQDDPASTYFLSANRNKESIQLDLKSEGGHRDLERLIQPTCSWRPSARACCSAWASGSSALPSLTRAWFCFRSAGSATTDPRAGGPATTRSPRARCTPTIAASSDARTNAFQGARWTVAGEAPRAMGRQRPTIVPYGAFATADGTIQIAVGNDYQWRAMAVDTRLDGDEPRFATARARAAPS